MLLDQIGVRYEVIDVDVPEHQRVDEVAAAYVERLALAKARAGWQSVERDRTVPVLGADTAVVLDDQILGKPRDRTHAGEMLAALSGRSHKVMTAVALVADDYEALRLSISSVTFRPTGAAERAGYLASGECDDKAGAYGIQGRGAMFVSRLEGSYSGVMGLPLFETAELLRGFGIELL